MKSKNSDPNRNLFREIKKHNLHKSGKPSKNTHLTFTVFIYTASTTVLLLVIYITQFEYTRNITIKGITQSANDLVRAIPRSSGFITHTLIHEGQVVEKNQVMFILNIEHYTQSKNVEETISQSINDRMKLLESRNNHQTKLGKIKQNELEQRINHISMQINSANSELLLQKRKKQISDEMLSRYRQLAEEGFISEIQALQKEEELLASTRDIETLQRNIQILNQEKIAEKTELASLPLKQENTQIELQQNWKILQQQKLENQAQQSLEIRSPIDSLVTAITAQTGQFVNPQLSVVTLQPLSAPLEAHLFAPSKTIGFIRPGAHVKLRYEAFPYQKFGHADGVVNSVSRTPLLPGEITSMPDNKEPMYRIKVSIKRNYIITYGKKSPLLPGMRLEADIQLEKRALYEWALEPLYSISGKIN